DVNLTATVVEPNGPSLFDKIRIEFVFADEIETGLFEVGVGDNRLATDAAAIDDNAGHLAIGIDFDAFDQRTNADIDAILLEFGLHLLNEKVGPPLECEHTFVHEVREDNPIGKGGIFEG